ncbi:MAG TPA: dynamin family protein [Chloroflexia bacterium]|nr:dynamin family protein [Chloroflexia bacterium]
MDILDNQQMQIRSAEQESLLALREAIEPLGPEAVDVAALKQAEADLEELFLLVVVGEFNSGKSAFINALLGEDVLPEGVTPTTASINLLRYGPQVTETQSSDFVTERTYPAPFLRDISIVDTPGTNAIIRQHEALTRTFVPRSDMVLFITSADRPFTESERGFMEAIREWGKKIVLVLNKIDLLGNQEELDRVLHFIEEHSVALLGQKSEIFPVSARLAKKARASDNFAERDALLRASHFDELEKYIFSTLDEAGRIRLKLLTPLGIAGRVAEKYKEIAKNRLAVLAEDFRTVENIEAQLQVYESDMKREFAGRISQIENIIYELRERGEAFFDQTIKASRIRDLLSGNKIKREFEERVVADSARRVDDATSGLIDWMVDQDLRLWQGVSEYLNRRRLAGGAEEASRRDEHMIGTVGGGFETSRQALLRSVVQEARTVIDSFDRRQEAEKIAQDMRAAVAGVVAAGGVAALGVIVSIAITSAFVDITGVTAALVSGAIGLFILPYRKRKALQEFRARTQELRDKLIGAMTYQFEAELWRSKERIRESIAPYTRFVRVEQDRVSTAQARLGEIEKELARLRGQIEGIRR